MKLSVTAGAASLIALLLLCLSPGCQADADAVVSRDRIVQLALADKGEAGKVPTILVVRYQVLVAPPQEHHIVRIALIAGELSISTGTLSEAQQALIDANTIGQIVHFPPARSGATGEVRLPIPQAAQQTVRQHTVLFQMLPANPEGTLDKSLLQIVAVSLE